MQQAGRTGRKPDYERKAIPFDFKSVKADGQFQGYASLFGKVDLGRDMVMPGAFRSSLEARGARGVKLLYQHDPNEPIGVWLDIKEDMRGLLVEGQLLISLARAREVQALMKAGALDGLSIGFHPTKAKTDEKSGLRKLYEVDLWEISIVTFPMQPQARIHAMKQAGHAMKQAGHALKQAGW
ncbi:MAG: HK97 family phage prohead protease [Parvibaculaceae bacterium]|nr:HK97 family phage prohead protease [Parvibaculaceae bacterium]